MGHFAPPRIYPRRQNGQSQYADHHKSAVMESQVILNEGHFTDQIGIETRAKGLGECYRAIALTLLNINNLPAVDGSSPKFPE